MTDPASIDPAERQTAKMLTAKIKAACHERPTALNGYGVKLWSKIEDDIAAALSSTPQGGAEPVDEFAGVDETLMAHYRRHGIAHLDHPPRHYDRTCPACQAEAASPAALVEWPRLPEGWHVEVKSDILRTIIVTAPNGYSGLTTNIDRNPGNVLRMLVQDLLAAHPVRESPAVAAPPEPTNFHERFNTKPEDALIPTPRPMAGLWVLVAPNGDDFGGDSPIECLKAEIASRVPAHVALARIAEALNEPAEQPTDTQDSGEKP